MASPESRIFTLAERREIERICKETIAENIASYSAQYDANALTEKEKSGIHTHLHINLWMLRFRKWLAK